MKRSLCVLAFVVAVVLAASQVCAADNPFLGTWKLNAAQSKFDPGPGPKSLTRTITAEGSGAKYSFVGTAADGSPISYSFTTNYDGKDVPVTGNGTPGGVDTISLKHAGANKTEGALKKGGKELGKVVAEVSKDGKTATVTSKVKGENGKEQVSVSVYDKQ